MYTTHVVVVFIFEIGLKTAAKYSKPKKRGKIYFFNSSAYSVIIILTQTVSIKDCSIVCIYQR